MEKFRYTRSYTFQDTKGRRKYYFFNLTERNDNQAVFHLRDKGNTDVINGKIILDGDTETVKFTYKDKEFLLSADRYIPKGYLMTPAGRKEKEEDKLRDAHSATWR